jgi:hypothetical protein
MAQIGTGVETRGETPISISKPVGSGVKYTATRAYGDGRQGRFQPSREQMRDARSWLVRVVARRAVDILKAQEAGR